MQLTTAQRQTLSWLLIALVGVLLVWLLSPVLAPFLIAGVLAYILRPAVERLVKRRVPRVLAVTLVEVLAFVTIAAVLLLIVPILSKELPLLREQLPLLADRLNRSLSPWLAQFGIQVSLDVASIKAFVVNYLGANIEDGLSAALSSARIGGSFLLTLIGNAVLIPVVLFYLLTDWPQLSARLDALVPPRFRSQVNNFIDESDDMLGQYLRGQLLVMIILAVYYSVALALFRFDLAVPVGVFTGLAVFIPYLGFGLGALLALLAGILQFASWYGIVAVAVVYGFGQVLESFFLTPRLVGERIGINPLTVIFALLAFGHLAGFVGVLIALPVCAVLVVATRRLRKLYIDSKLYPGMKQIPLAIGSEPLRSFENFVAGANLPAVAHLRALMQQAAPVYLWGASGVGKTHLLQALASQVQQHGGRASWFSASVPAPWPFEERSMLIVLDDCDRFGAAQQQAAFALFVEATTHGIPIAAAGSLPPVDLPLRDDLRSRLGWGHIFALQPLTEPEARAALRREADRRGLFLSDDVMDYLLTRFARDLKHLMALLDRLDEFALVHKRAITVPLLKQMLAEEEAQP